MLEDLKQGRYDGEQGSGEPPEAGQGDEREPMENPMPKYIFVTGGVVSSLGKGLAASSIGCLLESRGLRVALIKLDPYINVDPGTMSPFQHGEVFVTDDGARLISTWATTNASPTRTSHKPTTDHPEESTCQ